MVLGRIQEQWTLFRRFLVRSWTLLRRSWVRSWSSGLFSEGFGSDPGAADSLQKVLGLIQDSPLKVLGQILDSLQKVLDLSLDSLQKVLGSDPGISSEGSGV